MSDGAQKPKFSLEEESSKDVPELELTLTGLEPRSAFGKIVDSGLNAIASLTGSGRKKNDTAGKGFKPTVTAPLESLPPQKPQSSGYNPSWKNDSPAPDLNAEYTNFRSAIGEYEKQQAVMPRARVGGHGQIVIRRPRTGLPFVYKLAIVLILVLGAGITWRYLDKKYNIRQVIKELKDPSKSALKQKIKKPKPTD